MSWSEIRSTLALAFVLALGCGPTVSHGDGGTDTGSDDGSSSGGSSSSGSSSGGSSGGGSSSGGTGSSSGTGPGITSETSDTWPSTGGTGGTHTATPYDCPPSEGAVASWSVIDWPSDPGLLSCIVESAELDPNGRFVIFVDCGGNVATRITIAATPIIEITIEPGWGVELEYIEDQPWWIEYYFTLRAGPGTGTYADGDLIVAGMDATRPTPWGDDGLFRPFTLESWPKGCIPVPDLDSGCGDEERVAIGFMSQDGEWEVLDGSSARLEGTPPLRVNVERAVEYRNVMCEDFPESWYTAVFAAQP